jgi:peptide/nickel transport system substrate-binding protein
METRLFGEEFLESLSRYPRDVDAAESLLREAGLERDGDWWHKPDGTEFNPSFVAPTSVPFYTNGFQVAVSNLKEFGINAELNAVEGTTFFSQVIPNLDYGLTRGYYSNPSVPGAWFRSWFRYDGPGDKEYPAYLQEPHDQAVVEVPPIGEPDSDRTMSIDIRENYDEIRSSSDTSRIQELSKELCWAFNQSVPRIPVSQVPYTWYMTNDDWWLPPDETPMGLLQGIVWVLHQVGGIGSK